MPHPDQVMFGVHAGLQKTTVAQLQDVWTRVEHHGFDFASVWDHFYSADLNGPDCLEAVTTHTALAMSTSKVRVGCLVYSVGYRSVAVLAKAIANIDQISGGRAELGLGCGWHQPEYDAFGIPFESPGKRIDHLDEAVVAIRSLLHGTEPVTFDGTYVQLRAAEIVPRPVQAHLPITIGGGGEKRTLPMTARLADVWNIPFVPPEVFGTKAEVLRRCCESIGRDPAEIRRSVNVGLATSDENLVQQFGIMGEMMRPGVLTGGVDEMVDRVGAYLDAGADQINLAVRAPFDIAVIDAFAAVRDVLRSN